MKRLFVFLQYLAPHHLLSRFTAWFGGSEIRWLKNLLIRRFICIYSVNMEETIHNNSMDYASFNDFFTRPLKPDARPIDPAEEAVVCPADGNLSAMGDITGGRLIQAKGRHFSLTELLGGPGNRAAPFQEGSFAAVYLSPKDYHRVHMPFAGTLREMVYIPGRLFSVNQTTTNHVPNLFARNERLACVFDTAIGPMAVVMVGAMIVAGMEVAWAGAVTPRRRRVEVYDYAGREFPIRLAKGMEMGRFRLGSTVIVLFGAGAVAWRDGIKAESTVKMGELIGSGRLDAGRGLSWRGTEPE